MSGGNSTKLSQSGSKSNESVKRSPLTLLADGSQSSLALNRLAHLARKFMSCGVETREEAMLPWRAEVKTKLARLKEKRQQPATGDSKGVVVEFVEGSPRNIGLTFLFSLAVMKESLEDILEVVDCLVPIGLTDAPLPTKDNEICQVLPFSRKIAVRLFGVDPDSAVDGNMLSQFFSAQFTTKIDNSSSLHAFNDVTDLFGSLNWATDPSLTISDRQAISIMEAIATISSSQSEPFAIINDALLEILFVVAERGAVLLHRIHALLSSDQSAEAHNISSDRLNRRTIYLGACAFRIVFVNIRRLVTSNDESASRPLQRLLDVCCLEDELNDDFVNADTLFGNNISDQLGPITYRDRINRLCSLLVTNRLLDPHKNSFGQTAILFVNLKDALFPRPSQQFQIICNLLEKSEAMQDTTCERALVMKLMEGLEGPRLLELITAPPTKERSGADSSPDDDNEVEKFFLTILQLANRSVSSKLENEVPSNRDGAVAVDEIALRLKVDSATGDSTGPLSEQSLSEGIIRLLDPLGIQLFCTLSNTIMNGDKSDKVVIATPLKRFSVPLTRLLDMLARLLNSASDIINELNSRYDGISSGTAFLELLSSLSSSHIACLVPVALFGFGLLWKDISQQISMEADDVFSKLFPALQSLLQAVSTAVKTEAKLVAQSTASTPSSERLTPSAPDVVENVAVSTWEPTISNTSLTFTESNRLCSRPGSASCYPAAFAQCDHPMSTFTLKLSEANSTTNWLSIGFCCKGFAVASSDGFGRTSKSWYASLCIFVDILCDQ
jgi:hypothetical protein